MTPPQLSIIVFAYNEAACVATMLEELVAWRNAMDVDAEIVFVDDGSDDQTVELARERLDRDRDRLLTHDENRGMGAAIKTGVRASRGAWVTFLPADGQIPPVAVATLLSAASDDTELVLSTYERRDDGWHRFALSAGLRFVILLVHGVWLRSEGPYLFRRTHFDPDQLPPDTFFVNFEFPIRAIASGIRTATVRIPCRRRLAGHSKVTAVSRIARVARDVLDLRVRRARQLIRRAVGRDDPAL
jgi:glycosyltransferase involved in cell wall biosynthesis